MEDRQEQCAGHRKRLKDRFLKIGSKALEDYEILELILFFVIRRKDTKSIAKNLIKRFGDIGSILASEGKLLKEINGVGDQVVHFFSVIREIHQRQMRNKIIKKPILNCLSDVIDYCSLKMSNSKREHLRLLFLNHKNKLIIDEVHQVGTVNQVKFYPREVIERALDLGATSLIMVHNHPSGDPVPSESDVKVTKQIYIACDSLGLILHDHFIIGRNSYTSMKDLGYI